MAKLIPSFIDEGSPPGERDVYNLLASGPDDWVAIHSLDIAPWNRGLRTEIDFVVLIPDTGILCIEVKSQENISFENGRWSPSSIKRSPFKQAIGATQTFVRRLKEIAPHFQKVPVVHTCIFPRSAFSLSANLSVQSWELMDARIFRRFSSGSDFCADLKARARNGISSDPSTRILEGRLSKSQIDQILAFCVPVQRHRPDSREQIRHREQVAEAALREQQRPVLQMVEQNDRVVVSGGAGTGKTLIAMEVARRAADRGKRVALLCFNRLVGKWMVERMNKIPPPLPNLVVGRATQVMADMSGIAIPAAPLADFWNHELPQQLEERLTNPDFLAGAAFDFLVLDEAQDILGRPRLWECLKQFLAGGIDKGSFFLCGDFDHQILTERSAMERSLADLVSAAHPAKWRLTENCRNYRIIGDTAVTLSGLGNSVYSGYMRTGGSIQDYDIFFYENEDAQLNKLQQLLKDFQAAGYRASDISILSFRAAEASAAFHLSGRGIKLRDAQLAGDATAYTSVHAFKGMENKIIILTDVVLGGREFQRDLFYTGMTRATESVRVLCDKASQKTLQTWLQGRALA